MNVESKIDTFTTSATEVIMEVFKYQYRDLVAMDFREFYYCYKRAVQIIDERKKQMKNGRRE